MPQTNLQRECWLDSTQLGIIRLGRSGQRFLIGFPLFHLLSPPCPAPPPLRPPRPNPLPHPPGCKPKVLDTKHRPICFHLLPVCKLEFLSLLSTLIVFFASSRFSTAQLFLAPLSFCFLTLLPPLQSFRATVSCSKLAPAVRWPSLFAVRPRRTTRSV